MIIEDGSSRKLSASNPTMWEQMTQSPSGLGYFNGRMRNFGWSVQTNTRWFRRVNQVITSRIFTFPGCRSVPEQMIYAITLLQTNS